MKIIRFENEQNQVVCGIVRGDQLREAELLEGDLYGELRPTGETVHVKRLLAPVDPPNLLCVGLNYKEHAAEAHMEIPERPVLFLKTTTTVAAHDSAITLPALSYQVDWEGELAIVIGKAALNVTEEEALEYVLGYTCANDVSARDWQMHLDKQWCRGKSFDGFGPLGPVLVTRDEIKNPNALDLTTKVNGQVMQKSNTRDFIFNVQHMVSYLSQGMTLLPGTVILTGTPPGTGLGKNPPRFLRPGDVCEVTIEGIGTLRSHFVAAG